MIFILHSRSERPARREPAAAQNPVRYSRVGLGSTMRFRGRLLLIWCRAGTEAWLAPAAVMCEQERGTQSAVSQARVVDLVPVAPLDGAFSIVVETVSVLDERLAHLCRRARLAERQLERGVGGLHVGRVHERVRDRRRARERIVEGLGGIREQLVAARPVEALFDRIIVQVVFDGARLGTGLGGADALLVHAREEGHLLGLRDAIESACRDLLKVAASLIDAVATSRMAHGWDELEVVRLAELPGRESNVRS